MSICKFTYTQQHLGTFLHFQLPFPNLKNWFNLNCLHENCLYRHDSMKNGLPSKVNLGIGFDVSIDSSLKLRCFELEFFLGKNLTYLGGNIKVFPETDAWFLFLVPLVFCLFAINYVSNSNKLSKHNLKITKN